MLGDLENLLNSQKTLIFVGRNIDKDNVCLHRFDLAKDPAVQRRVEIVQLGSDFQSGRNPQIAPVRRLETLQSGLMIIADNMKSFSPKLMATGFFRCCFQVLVEHRPARSFRQTSEDPGKVLDSPVTEVLGRDSAVSQISASPKPTAHFSTY